MKMHKLLLIQNKITLYNLPIFNRLAKNYELTCIYTQGKAPENCEFQTIKLETKKLGPIYFHEQSLKKIANRYDVVITDMAYKWLSILFLFFGKRKYKLIAWGIGVAASYNVKYDEKRITNNILELMIKKADACVFYSDYPVSKYRKKGFNSKLFVAHNTVAVLKIDYQVDNRNDILFVGSLYKEKGLVELIESYNEAYKINKNIPNMLIVGDGSESVKISELIKGYYLEEKITMLGAIYDEQTLSEIYQRSLICISPNQAGLSVQQSLGYGTPFLTTKGAITGGEIFDIINGENGLILDSINQLKDVILDLSQNRDKYLMMGRKGFDYYYQNCTIDKMYSGFADAINFVLNGGK